MRGGDLGDDELGERVMCEWKRERGSGSCVLFKAMSRVQKRLTVNVFLEEKKMMCMRK